MILTSSCEGKRRYGQFDLQITLRHSYLTLFISTNLNNYFK